MPNTLSLQILRFSKQLKKTDLYTVEAITELIHKNCYARHTFTNLFILSEILSSQGGDNEECCLLGCDAV
jgi:hypothetical protein